MDKIKKIESNDIESSPMNFNEALSIAINLLNL